MRLDVSRLTFVDVTGLRAMIVGLADARQDGWNVELGRTVTDPVRRLIELLDAGSLLWPER